MSRIRPKHMMIAATVVAAITMLSSCMQEVPIVSSEPGNQTTNMTLDEQREWVGEQFDAAIAASGVAEGWYDIYDKNVLWARDRPEDRTRTLNSLFPRDCGSGGRLDESLKNMSAEDPLAAAAAVHSFWESEGWAVSDIRSYESDPYFRADGEDGAQLAFQASKEGMSLEVATACSVNNTVTNWRLHSELENESEE
ncbi:hypothetical protein [Leucobacter sp. USHLN154]|uniref:hypothetical protein n=1 Tax=Leucobacter sp. USHLN154 TaxID=3081269 RepID=UPI003019E368